MKIKKAFTAVTACALSFTMAFAFTACGGGDEDKKDDVKPEKKVTSIVLKESVEIEVGSGSGLVSEIKYSDGSTSKTNDKSITWSSSNPSVATVSNGYVTGAETGEAEISAKFESVSSNVCKVTVISGRVVSITDSDGNPIPEEGLTLDVEENPTAQLKAVVTRDGVALEGQEVEWANGNATAITVSQNGLVTAIEETEEPVTITATIKDTSISSSVAISATWSSRDNYTFDASTYEQNKSPAGIWNYWGDKNYNWTNTDIKQAYVDPNYETGREPDEGYFYIGANKVTTVFSVDNTSANVAAIQLFYRSAGEEGKLLSNHNYELKLKIKSSAAGTVSLNDYRKKSGAAIASTEIGEITEKWEAGYEFEIEADKETTLTVQFRHGDTGAIFMNNFWENIESAIQLCLGMLGENKEDVKVEVYDIQYKDLGEAINKWTDDETKHRDYIAPPPTGTEGNTYEAVYTDYNNDGDTLATESTWAVWYAQDGWGCGNAVDMNVAVDSDNKNCTIKFNPNGNENNWGVQLRYIPAGVEAGQMYKVHLSINSTVAYTISINGQDVALEVGDNEIEFYWTAGTYILDGNINNANYEGEITLVLSGLTWTELIQDE